MRICCTMIVKNEAHVLRRCLESVLPLVDCFCVCDTGSTDNTESVFWDVVESQAVEADFVHHAWENFGANRTQAFRAAERLHNLGREDWHLVIDADDTLERSARLSFQEIAALGLPPVACPELDIRQVRAMISHRPEVDAWKLEVLHSGTQYYRGHLFRADGKWEYHWPLHEAPFQAGAIMDHLPGLQIRFGGDGHRSQQDQREKYLADAQVIEAWLRQHPTDTRMVFYLAQSLKDAGEAPQAIETYLRRARMGGWAQEAYYSLLQAGRLMQLPGQDRSDIRGTFLRAFRMDPTRAEAPYELSRYMTYAPDCIVGTLAEGWAWAEVAASRPAPTKDHLFAEPDVWEWSRNLAAQLRGRLCG